MSSSVFLLGAGFSRAVSGRMPLMDELSKAIQRDLRSGNMPPIPGERSPLTNNFEQWLNYLIDEPPWLTEGNRLRNRGAFSDIADSLHRVLLDRQAQVVNDGQLPEWLAKLVTHWYDTRATVITFNYDTLIEAASMGIGPTPWPRLYSVPVAPIAQRVAGTWGLGDTPPGLQLLKLHGSLNWWYSGPASPPGDPVFWTDVRGWGAEGPSSDPKQLTVDKVPLIVPPAAIKSPYYGNNMIRTMWRQAAKALRSAEELVIMGFSLPPSDQIVRSLLATELNAAARVTPVDYGHDIVENVRKAVGDDREINTSHAGRGERAIPEWADDAVGQH